MSEHVSQVLSACASSIFVLLPFTTHSLNNDLVARAINVGSIMYAIPAWWGSRAKAIGSASESSWRDFIEEAISTMNSSALTPWRLTSPIESYSDLSSIVSISTDVQHLRSVSTSCISDIADWMKCNRLQLNSSKSEF